MAISVTGDRTETVASMLIALVEAKVLFPDGGNVEARAIDFGKAFKALYDAVKQAEKGG
jgi:hypothetical protein